MQDRERVCNDTMNTGVTAALVGGFALNNVTDMTDVSTGLDMAVCIISIVAVHGCTCSALTSALIYRKVNRMQDDAVEPWASGNQRVLALPLQKFGLGCFSYLLSVVLMGWRALAPNSPLQGMGMAIGVMSMLSALAIAVYFALGLDVKPTGETPVSTSLRQ